MLFIGGMFSIFVSFSPINSDKIVNVFTVISIGTVYCALYIPILFFSINTFLERISFFLYFYIEIAIYSIASIIIIVLLQYALISLTSALFIQAIALILLGFHIYFGFSALPQKALKQTKSKNISNEIRTAVRCLDAYIKNVPPDYQSMQKILKRILNTLSYSFPSKTMVDSARAHALLVLLTRLIHDCKTINDANTPVVRFALRIQQLEALTRELEITRREKF
jgi:hypothetical protein